MTATGIYLDEELNTTGRAYWAMSRMVNHGWSVLSFGLDCGGDWRQPGISNRVEYLRSRGESRDNLGFRIVRNVR